MFYTKYTHPTLICRGADARTDGRTHGRMDGRTENIYSIFRDKLLLLGEHVYVTLIQYIFNIVQHEIKHILFYCEIILLFLSHNKLSPNDQINCFIINACILLFSTLSKMVSLFSLYIFGLNKNLSDPFHCIRVII